MPLKPEILKGLILDTQKQGGPTLETINKPFRSRKIKGHEYSIHACFCICNCSNHQEMELKKLIEISKSMNINQILNVTKKEGENTYVRKCDLGLTPPYINGL